MPRRHTHAPWVSDHLYYSSPARLEEILSMPPPDSHHILNGWSTTDKPDYILVRGNGIISMNVRSEDRLTGAVRGRAGVKMGYHVWEVTWPIYERDFHSVIGVGTSTAPLHMDGHKILVGGNDKSWGWALTSSSLYYHKKIKDIPYPFTRQPAIPPEKFLMIADMDAGTLAFMADGKYLGIAFTGLKGTKVYPMASSVWAYSTVTIRYLGGLNPEPAPLIEICRKVLVRSCGPKLMGRLERTSLPAVVKEYILHNDRTK